MTLDPRLTEAFARILKRYVADGGERWLAGAADLGRRAVREDTPIEDIAEVFEAALTALVEEFPDMPLREVARQLSAPLAEVLMGFGLAFREQLGRKEAERRAREHERLLGAIYRGVPIAMGLADRNDRLVSVNQGWLDLFGGAEAEAVGRSLPEFGIEGGIEGEAGERVLRARGGEERTVQVGSAVIDGERRFRVVTLYDITELRRQAEALRRRDMLESLGKMASGVAHEINNLLQPILALTEIAIEDLGSPDADAAAVRPLLETVLDSGYKSRDIVRNFLAFARRESVVNEPVALGAALERAIAFAGCALPPSLGVRVYNRARAARILANETQLSQVVLNLIANAAEAMDRRGVVEITVERVAVEAAEAARLGLAAGHCVRLAVADRGHGMDEATLAHALEPFFTTKPAGAGTGLGLSVVYGIVRSWNGAVTLASRPGHGTTVTLLIPVLEDAPAAPAAPAPAPAPASPAASPAAP